MAQNNVIQLIIKVTNQATGPLKQLNSQIRSTTQSVTSLGTAGRGAAVFANLRQGATQLRGALGQVRMAIRSSVVAMTGWRSIVVFAALFKLGQQATGYADSLRSAENKIRLVTTSQTQLVAVNKMLYATAQRSRIAYDAIVDVYSRVARSSQELGVSQREVIQFTESVAKSITIAGSTSKEASAGMIQLGQALASGALRGDELRSVMEQMPRLSRAIADGLGVTIGSLRAMGEAGELTSERIFKALMSQREILNEEFGKIQKTVGGAAVQTRNALQQMVGQTLNAAGTTQSLVDSLDNLTRFLESPEAREGFAGFLAFLSDAATLSARAAASVGRMWGAFNDRVIANSLDFLPVANERLETLRENLGRLEAADPGDIRELMSNYNISKMITGPTTFAAIQEAELKGAEEFKNTVIRLYKEKIEEIESVIGNVRLNVRGGATLGGQLAADYSAGGNRRGSAAKERRERELLDKQMGEALPVLTKEQRTVVINAIRSAENEFQKQRRIITDNITELEKFINVFSKLDEASMKKIGIEPANIQQAQAAVGQLRSQLAELNREELTANLEIDTESMRKSFNTLTNLQQQFLDDTSTAAQQAAAEWGEFVGKLQSLRDQGVLDPGEYDNRLKEYLNSSSGMATEASAAIESLMGPVEKLDKEFRDMAKSLADYLTILMKEGGDPARIAEVREALRTIPEAYRRELESAAKETNEWLIFQERAAERLQDAFSNAFMEIGNGARAFFRSLVLAMQQIVAEAAALEFAKLFKLNEVISKGLGVLFGKSGSGTESRVTEMKATTDAILQGTQATVTSTQQQTQTLAQAISASAASIKELCACPGEVPMATSVMDSVADVVIPESTKKVEIPESIGQIEIPESIGQITEESVQATKELGTLLVDSNTGLFGGLMNLIRGVVEKVVSAIVGLRSVMIGSGGGGGGDGFWGSLMEGVGMLFAAAGGGTVPQMAKLVPARAGGGMVPVRVGEEGPETAFLPVGTRIMNSRQMAFAGGGGGTQLNYQPQYNIRIEGAGDAGETEARLATYLARRDAKLKYEITEMLHRNGMGRMR